MTSLWAASLIIGAIASGYVATIGIVVAGHGGPVLPARLLALNAITWGLLCLALYLLSLNGRTT